MPDVLVSLFTNKIGKMLSHVVNITLPLLELPEVNYGNSVDHSYCTEKQKAELLIYAIYIHFKSTNLHITVCGILIEKDWI